MTAQEDGMHANTPMALVGAGYGSLDRALADFTTVWGRRGDGDFHHTSVAVLAKDRNGQLQVERSNSTAKHLQWGGALLGAALCLLVPSAGIAMLAGVGLSGAGAMIDHFQQHAGPEKVAQLANRLDGGAAGVVVVTVNRRGRAVSPLLRNAIATSSVDMVWGDLEEELALDFA